MIVRGSEDIVSARDEGFGSLILGAEALAAVGHDGFDLLGGFVLIPIGLRLVELLVMGLFLPGELKAFVVDVDAVGGELGARGFALGGELEALFIERSAVLEGEDAEEILEQGGAGGG